MLLSVSLKFSSGPHLKNLKIKIYQSIILPVILYVCETGLVTLSEARRLRGVKIRLLRKIFIFK